MTACVHAQAPTSSERAQRDYAAVAQHLVPPLLGNSPPKEVAMERAVIEAKERWRVVTLRSLETADRRIEVVAREGAEAHAKLLDQAADAGDDSTFAILASLLINPALVVLPLAREADQASARVARYETAVQRRRAASFLLSDLAQEFAGPAAEKPPFGIDFDEHWFGPPGPDRVSLVNESGRDLSNCTVQVDLRGKKGKWVRNIHFVAAWPKGQKLWADYFSVDPREVAALAGTTAIEVQELKVSLWCVELRAESISVPYDDVARQADQQRQLDTHLDLVLDYVARPWIEKGPCIGITMREGGTLSSVKIDVTCRGDGEPTRLTHTVREWPRGARVSVQSFGELAECPSTVDVEITVEGLPQAVTRKGLKISSRR